jgi:hypothetical protein
LPFINVEIPGNDVKNTVDYELKHGKWTESGWSRRVWKAFSRIRVVLARRATHKTQENSYAEKTSLGKEFYVLVIHLSRLLFLLIIVSLLRGRLMGLTVSKLNNSYNPQIKTQHYIHKAKVLSITIFVEVNENWKLGEMKKV